MKFGVSNKDKVAKFLAITKNMKHMVNEVNLGICERGLYVQGMDSSHVGMFEWKLEKDWFDIWKGKEEFHYNMGINCESLSMIMNCHTQGQYIELSFMENSTQELIIKFEGKGHDKMFELKLIDIDCELMEIPDVEYDADITMKSGEFNNLMAEASIFGETIKIELGIDDNIYMATDGSVVYKVRIKEENIVEYALAEEATIKHSYALKYCLLFSKFCKLNKNVKLHLKDETPLKVIYNLEHWLDISGNEQEDDDEDEEKSKNFIAFYLAPKLEDDDLDD
tara:strand:- start:7926 stop:8765 length:840 start_codon:yes stop_codon:yes gene_type:complete